MSLRNPRPLRFVAPAATLLLALLAAPASSQLDARALSTLGHAQRFQPPPVRLHAMGGLVISVPDEYNELNLWDFAGLPLGLVHDRDSTSFDAWVDRAGLTLDRTAGDVEYEVLRDRDFYFGGQGILRTGRAALGFDIGRLGVNQGEPVGDLEHESRKVSMPVLRPVGTGPLWRSLHWGLSALFGQESLDERWFRDEVRDGRVKVTDEGEQLMPPDLFTPDNGDISFRGLQASLGYVHARWGTAGAFYDRLWEDVILDQRGIRSVYETTDPREWTGFGAALHSRLRDGLEVAAVARRRYRGDVERYRFSLSGGSTSDPLAVRGDRVARDERQDEMRVRVLGDLGALVDLAVTVGGEAHTGFRKYRQAPSAARATDFNAFVLGRAAGDTLIAPPLVQASGFESRVAGFGFGASSRLLPELLVGAEFHWERDAFTGDVLHGRSRDWDVRGGGQYDLSPRWSILAGWRHYALDPDVFLARNEWEGDRVSAGAEARDLSGWRLVGEGFVDMRRTDFPDPGELGGSGWGFSLHLGREF